MRDYVGRLLDDANAPMLILGKLGEVRRCNRAFLALTAYTRDGLLGKQWMGFLPQAEQRRLLPVYARALRGEPSINVPGQLPRRDGSLAQVAIDADLVLGPDGEVEGVIYIYKDLTKVRELEGQIIQSEKLAALGQLVAGVVHELNNPLTNIAVYSDYLLKKWVKQGADQADTDKLQRVVVSAERMLKFTRDLVTYARPSAEKPLAFDLRDVIEQSIGFCSHVMAEVGATVEQQFAPDLPAVYGVKSQLVQVLVNLITNACQALPVGAGQIRFETRAVAHERVLLRVSDNGRGIPADKLQRIFEPFFTTKPEGQGTGLGLSIVRNIIQQHRGEIRVTSAVGQGTSFEVVLPCRPETVV
jgi:PAS domain S-box-containing protein